MRTGRRAFLGGVVSTAFLACKKKAAPGAAPIIKIGYTGPLSGPVASVGKMQSIAIMIGVEEINASGGIHGAQLELTTYDDELKPDRSVTRVREAHAANVVALFGPVSSTQWETVVPVLNELKLPGFNANANKPGINVPPYAVRMAQPDDKCLPPGLDEFLKLYPGTKRVVCAGDIREAAGRAAIDLFARLAKERNLEVLEPVSFTSNQPDFSSTVIALKEKKADALLISILASDAARLARELQVREFKQPILANAVMWPGVFPQTVSKTVGADAANWHVVGFATNDYASGDAQRYERFVKLFDERVGKDPALAQFQPPNIANTSCAYDAVMLMAEGLRNKGVTAETPVTEAREKLREHIATVKTYRGVNQYTFDDKQNGTPPPLVLKVDPARAMWTRASQPK